MVVLRRYWGDGLIGHLMIDLEYIRCICEAGNRFWTRSEHVKLELGQLYTQFSSFRDRRGGMLSLYDKR